MDSEEMKLSLEGVKRRCDAISLQMACQEQRNITLALDARVTLAPLQERLSKIVEDREVREMEESTAQHELNEAEMEGKLIKDSGRDHGLEKQKFVAEALAKAMGVEQANMLLVNQFEDEVLSLLGRLGALEKRRSEISKSLTRRTP